MLVILFVSLIKHINNLRGDRCILLQDFRYFSPYSLASLILNPVVRQNIIAIEAYTRDYLPHGRQDSRERKGLGTRYTHLGHAQ
jgi:hypothetical protein